MQGECGVDDTVESARCVFTLRSRESWDQTGENPQLLLQSIILQSLEPEQEETHTLSANLHTHTHFLLQQLMYPIHSRTGVTLIWFFYTMTWLNSGI